MQNAQTDRADNEILLMEINFLKTGDFLLIYCCLQVATKCHFRSSKCCKHKMDNKKAILWPTINNNKTYRSVRFGDQSNEKIIVNNNNFYTFLCQQQQQQQRRSFMLDRIFQIKSIFPAAFACFAVVIDF